MLAPSNSTAYIVVPATSVSIAKVESGKAPMMPWLPTKSSVVVLKKLPARSTPYSTSAEGGSG